MLRPATPFADFVLNTRFEDIPEEAIERVKDLILDLIAVSAAAAADAYCAVQYLIVYPASNLSRLCQCVKFLHAKNL